MLVAEKKISVAEFRQMDFDGEDAYYELINGEVVKKSAPTPLHQECSFLLTLQMGNFVVSNNIGKIFPAPVDVYLHEFSHQLPDLVFVSTKNLGIIDDKNGIIGVPDIVVEIISPSSVYKDRVQKNGEYEAAGVPEYWLVDCKNQTVEIYENVDGKFHLHSFAAESGKVTSKVLENFELEITSIFPPEQ
ncbi:MAG: Uma2 family endonuclease [Saprospiraceae bacterium]|nr:Uma2 family endonuclease [Saprospiraceae bacterium]MCF8250630.1 Uma2 family endonuclease [Saprospiraceae bacterium]MCF8282405.1 Uma2 family endonuclease [Bacteroidales bacterium]MCF8312261.1 Uma2 family endonuclease [Saprospiraceae bacterium]MCF8442818.1 Uma2 family endonuclease [Saprospiraceae bacterium]